MKNIGFNLRKICDLGLARFTNMSNDITFFKCHGTPVNIIENFTILNSLIRHISLQKYIMLIKLLILIIILKKEIQNIIN